MSAIQQMFLGNNWIPRNWLVAEYLLATNSNDTSGNGNNGTDTSMSYSWSEATFNGSTSKITTTSVWWMTEFSVWFWMYLTSDITGSMLASAISSEITGNTYWFTIHWNTYNWNNNEMGFYISSTFSWNAWMWASLSLNTWYYVVWIKTSTLHYLYIDNVLKWSFNSGAYTSVSQTQAFWVNSVGLSSRFFPWKIKKTRIYNRVLNATEIALLYADF